ncbi:hypothetical protein [Paenibacillus qinlingensis]|uniref:hypothetical protein n=1 Tax=Paenibacillus qinlingensis TaxID=1837343 RepID=UPI0015642184|nr:hypothetical protein [Paenibacillus qinlingensis]NQX63269.1 hypothetical protein [Paenibacillus qinlingensis]
MTVVINYLSNNYSIVATDTRLTFNTNEYRDDIIKLRSLPIPLGFVAGVGFSTFLERYKDFMAFPISGAIDIKARLLEAARQIIIETPEHKFGVENSEVYVSWITNDGKNNYCKIGVMATQPAQKEDEIFYIKENTMHIAYPSKFPKEKIAEIEEKHLILNGNYLDLWAAINLVITIFRDISFESDGVSYLCHIGIQVLDGANIRKYIAIENVIRLIENPQKHFLELKLT